MTSDNLQMIDYAGLLDDLPALVCEFLPDSTLIYANRKYAEYFQSTPEELVGMRFLDLIPPDARKAVKASYMALTPENPVIDYEHEVMRAGHRHWHSRRDRALFNLKGEVVRYRSMGMDITRRKQAEMDLKHALERYDKLALESGAFAWEVNEQGLYTYVGPSVEKVTGYKPGELVGMRHYYELAPEEDRAELISGARRTFSRAEPLHQFENRILCKDGTLRWVATTGNPVVDMDGRLIGYRGVDLDITTQKNSEEELSTRRARENAILAAIPDMMFVFNREGLLLDYSVNDKSSLLIPPEEFLNRTLSDVLPVEASTAIHEACARALSNGLVQVAKYELEMDGRSLHFEARIIRMSEDRLLSIVRNVTEEWSREQRLLESERRNRALLNAIPDMVFVVDREGRYLDFHAPAGSPLMVPPEYFIGRLMLEVHGEDMARLFGDSHRRAWQSGALQTVEYMLEIGGEKRHFESRASPMDANRVVSVVRDITESKQQHQALLDSEERYRLLVDNQNDLVVKVDGDGRLEFVSPSYCDLFGKDEDELLGREFMPLVHEEDRAGTAEAMMLLHAPPYRCELEQRAWTRHGWRWLAWSDRAVLDEQGRVCSVIGVGRDITERKDMEVQRGKVLEQLMQAQEVASIGSWEYDVIADRLTWSDETYRLFGVNKKVFRETYAAFQEMVHPEDLDEVRDVFARSLADPSFVYDIEHRIVRKSDGAIRHVHERCRHRRDAKGKVIQSLGVVQDITDQVLARAERDRLIQAIEQTGEIILLTTPDGTITYVNAAFERVTGYRREDVLGENPKLLKSGFHDKAFYRDLWQTITSGETWKGRLINRRKDGSLYTEEASISPIFNKQGCIEYFVAAKSDITHQLSLDAQLVQAQKLESIGRLAGGVAHDYNNMLQVILSCAESAMEEAGPASVIYPELSEICATANKSAAITRQLLLFARQPVGKPEVVDFNGCVSNMMKMLGRLIGPDIRLEWHPEKDPWPVTMATTHVDQVLANLCINARDAMAEGGQLVLATRNVGLREEDTRLPGQQPGDYLRLTVEDTGCGMKPEVLERIFEPFYTTKEQGKGTGLGLSTVYGIVRQAAGFISVKSEVGVGTRFTIDFPRALPRDATGQESRPPVKSAGAGQTLLVVDDEQAILRRAVAALSRQGYEVLSAGSAAEAIAVSLNRSIDLLVTDVMMPGANGWELARTLRARQPYLRCLFMSGYTENLQRPSDWPDDTVLLAKPFSLNDLVGKVAEALQSTRGSGNPGSASE
ncbi:MAG TPA: PAS domain S-box protein [Kiritimatiellia bacterium]|nr:PAS domain S-box protein [Kiritimatiellia bacterium]